jgi:hypothetical protein
MSYTTALPGGTAPASAFDCANREINGLGYVVVNASKETGFIRAERKITGAGEAAKNTARAVTAVATLGIVGGVIPEQKYDGLTATVVPDGAGNQTLRVTAARLTEKKGQRKSGGPTAQGQADAQSIIGACGLRG